MKLSTRSKKFIKVINKLTPTEFIGLAKVMHIPLVIQPDESVDLSTIKVEDAADYFKLRAIEDIIPDLLQAIDALDRDAARCLYKLISEADHMEDGEDASDT